MPDRPSEPLLLILREFIRRKGLNTAELALKLGLDRATLRQRLSGEEPLTVDDLIQLGKLLDIKPEEMAGIPIPDAPAPGGKGPRLSLIEASAPTLPEEDWTPDPTGNLTLQAVKYGFGLGVDMFVIFDTEFLDDSGIPSTVLKQFKDKLPIEFPAKYQRYNRPRFEEDGFECVLSFDKLYTCFFPWQAFVQVQYRPPQEAPPKKAPPPPPTPAPSPSKGSHLRVVK